VAADPVTGKGGLRIAHPAAKHGILTGFGGTVRLPEILGGEGAGRLFRDFETWDEGVALAQSAVHRVVDPLRARTDVLAWLTPSGGPR
jgi:enoyl-CoA hydratase/carnithine racemase